MADNDTPAGKDRPVAKKLYTVAEMDAARCEAAMEAMKAERERCAVIAEEHVGAPWSANAARGAAVGDAIRKGGA